MVDKYWVGSKLAQIDTYLHQIGRFSKISLPQYKKIGKPRGLLRGHYTF